MHREQLLHRCPYFHEREVYKLVVYVGHCGFTPPRRQGADKTFIASNGSDASGVSQIIQAVMKKHPAHWSPKEVDDLYRSVKNSYSDPRGEKQKQHLRQTIKKSRLVYPLKIG